MSRTELRPERADGDPPPLFNPLIEQAIELAAQWHGGTFRKSTWRSPAFDVPPEAELRVPVIAHVAATAMMVQRAGWDDITVAAAYLHDTLEDVNRYGASLRRERLVTLLGAEITNLVDAVTEQKLDDEGNTRRWRDRKEDYARQLRDEAPVEAVAISLADKLHNLWTVNQSLERGYDVFTSEGNRTGLSAGPDEQRWFHHAILDASRQHDDERLVPLRERLAEEVARFERLTGLS